MKIFLPFLSAVFLYFDISYCIGFPKLQTIEIDDRKKDDDKNKYNPKVIIHNSTEITNILKNEKYKNIIIELIFGTNSCNDIREHYVLSNFSNLEIIIVKMGSFVSLNSLKIIDNPKLKKISIEDGTDALNSPFYKLNSLTLSSII